MDIWGLECGVGSPSTPCAFCDIVAGRANPDGMRRGNGWVAFIPLEPVCDGHLLVAPVVHVPDALADPDVTAMVAAAAARLARPPCNLITSVGAAATQTISHLHVHIVPRRLADGLTLPWTHQRLLYASD